MIIVNKETCIGCRACEALCPDTFKVNDDGISEVMSQEDFECAQNAVESCPVQAISIS